MPILRITVQRLDRRARCANRSRWGASSIPKIEPLRVIRRDLIIRPFNRRFSQRSTIARRRPGWRNRFIFKPIVIITCRDRLRRSAGYLFLPCCSWMNVDACFIWSEKTRGVRNNLGWWLFFFFFFFTFVISLWDWQKKNFCGFLKKRNFGK